MRFVRAAFPDFQNEIEVMVEEGVCATSRVPPTNRSAETMGGRVPDE
jgi:hypothetical protein